MWLVWLVGQQKNPISVHLVCHPPNLTVVIEFSARPGRFIWEAIQLYLYWRNHCLSYRWVEIAKRGNRLMTWWQYKKINPREYPHKRSSITEKKLDITKSNVVSFYFFFYFKISNFENVTFKKKDSILVLANLKAVGVDFDSKWWKWNSYRKE